MENTNNPLAHIKIVSVGPQTDEEMEEHDHEWKCFGAACRLLKEDSETVADILYDICDRLGIRGEDLHKIIDKHV